MTVCGGDCDSMSTFAGRLGIHPKEVEGPEMVEIPRQKEKREDGKDQKEGRIIENEIPKKERHLTGRRHKLTITKRRKRSVLP